MRNTRCERERADILARGLPATTSIAAAVFFALYGMPRAALGDQSDVSSTALAEVTVTATRRKETLESVPYSLSVVTPEQLAASGATDRCPCRPRFRA